jgi:hypothetical protein
MKESLTKKLRKKYKTRMQTVKTTIIADVSDEKTDSC